MFEKIKLKKKNKRLSKFMDANDAHWFSEYKWDLDVIGDRDLKKMSGDGDLIDAIKNWYVYKDIKALAKPGDMIGADYIRYFEDCYEYNPSKYPSGNGTYEYYKGGLEGGYGLFSKGSRYLGDVINAVIMALKGDDDFWYGGRESPSKESPAYATLYRATGWGISTLLMWPLAKDPEAFFNGTSGYAEFLRAILKAYESHGQSPLWAVTMKMLADPQVLREKDRERTRTCSVLCCVFPDWDGNIDYPGRTSWLGNFGHDTQIKDMGRRLMPYAPYIEGQVEQHILFNDAYWKMSEGSHDFQEIWDYYGKLNDKAMSEAIEDYWNDLERNKKEREEEAQKKNVDTPD